MKGGGPWERTSHPRPPAPITSTGGENYVISPITGERILESKLADHLKISLLDPKWMQDKKRMEAERLQRQQEHKLQSKIAMENLRDLAERRTDIFGVGDQVCVPVHLR